MLERWEAAVLKEMPEREAISLVVRPSARRWRIWSSRRERWGGVDLKVHSVGRRAGSASLRGSGAGARPSSVSIRAISPEFLLEGRIEPVYQAGEAADGDQELHRAGGWLPLRLRELRGRGSPRLLLPDPGRGD